MEEDDFRRLDLPSRMPKTLTELHNTIRQAFGIERDFRIQFMDPDFNNEFMNATLVQDIQDRGTIKLVYILNYVDMSPSSSEQNAPSTSKQNAPSTPESFGSPASIRTTHSVSSLSSSDSDNTIILPHSDSELRAHAWPREFTIPRFPYDVEVQLQRGNENFRETGTRLKITPGLKSDIIEKLAEEIFIFVAYPQNHQIDQVAGALIQKMSLFARHICHWLLCLDD